ncbi:MAG: AMP-binding protein, partial [Acidobacteria bacterium]|nr:AMP-binding protein [Acidobacteriota bacterium]
MVPRDTLLDFFDDLSRLDGEFLVHDDGYRRRHHSYTEVGQAARAFAARLAAAGLQREDKVVFWGENRPEWIACYWGCLLIGVVVVPIDYRSPAEFVAKVARLVSPRVVLVGDDVTALAAADVPGAAVWRLGDFDWAARGTPPTVPV